MSEHRAQRGTRSRDAQLSARPHVLAFLQSLLLTALVCASLRKLLMRTTKLLQTLRENYFELALRESPGMHKALDLMHKFIHTYKYVQAVFLE